MRKMVTVHTDIQDTDIQTYIPVVVALSKCLAMELSSCILTLLRRSSGADLSYTVHTQVKV